MKQIVWYQNGNRLSYAECGDKNGYPILIMHGLIAGIEDYYLFQRLVDSGARLISVARPGYGESTPYEMRDLGEWGEIVAVLVEALELSEFDVLGISSGAPYSYATASWLPEKVRHVYILSGTPALYDEKVQSFWPYEIQKDATIPELQALARQLFFAGAPEAELAKDYMKDSLNNNCFGIAQDLKLRVLDWGFRLETLPTRVTMRHSRADRDVPFVTAELTSLMLPNCKLEARQNDEHFSPEILDDFLRTEVCRALAT
jgi:pimeloyl-ACP methyl ester carboxylesterase